MAKILKLLAARLFDAPHLVLPSYAETVVSVLADRLEVQPIVASEDLQVDRRAVRDPVLLDGGLLVVPIVGGLYHRGDWLDAFSGAQSYTNLQNTLIEAVANRDVKGILLDIDSPGGEARGCFEFADAIAGISKQKPVRAIANGLAASAAYAIGCAADHFAMTPSGEVGSVGVVWMHTDMSAAIEKRGVVITHLYAGKHKIDGTSVAPLSEQARAEFQGKIDTAYGMFVEHVASRREISTDDVRSTEARTFLSEQAKSLGLVDEIASFDEVRAAFVSDLNPKYRVSPNGVVSRMSKPNTTPVAQGATIEGLDEALATARAEGAASARAENETAVREAYKLGRGDAAAIMGHANAAGRMSAAAKIVGNHKLSVDEAAELLASLPEDGGSNFQQKLVAADPKVRAETSAPGATAGNDFQASVAANVKLLKGARA